VTLALGTPTLRATQQSTMPWTVADPYALVDPELIPAIKVWPQNTFPELRPLALTSGLFFLLAYTSIAVYLALPTVRGYFVPRTSSPLQD
jgi:hypothetical protein